jgi:glycosyltransferase involved in cell wall biosynthesis
MRIGINFHTADRYMSGVEYCSLGLLNGLVQIDSQNQYIVFTNRPELLREHVPLSRNLMIHGVKHLGTRTARILWEHTRLPDLVRRTRLDVLHCLSYICPVRKSPVPYIVTIHDTIAIDHPEWCKKTNALYFKLFMKFVVSRASRIISVSKCTAEDLKRNFPTACSKVHVVYPGIDRIFRSRNNSPYHSKLRARYHLPARYILYVGNLEPKKNIGAVLETQKRIREAGFPHKLVVVGKRSWGVTSQLREISKETGPGHIVSLGYVKRNDLPFIYQMADVFVFPSLYEGFGFPPLEAMACGIPAVTSSKGALGETMRDAALMVEPRDVNRISEAVLSLITDRDLREKHIRMGLARSRLFSWEEAARQTLSIYEEAVSTQ